jgi:toxin secretion/phage lysis holin
MKFDINNYRLALNTFAGVLGALGAYLYGGWTETLTTLFVFCVIDYFSGLAVAAAGKSEKTESGGLNSSVGFLGILKKVFVFIVSAVVHGCETMLLDETVVFTQGVVIAFACNEAISILENAGLLGVDLGPVSNLIEILKKKTKGSEENDS